MDSIPEGARLRLKEILPGISARGFNMIAGELAANSNVLLANKDAILIKNKDGLYYLFANYDFDPQNGTLDKLRDALTKVKVLMITHSLENASTANHYHKIPEWLKNFSNLECLILDNVALDSETPIERLRLKLLGIQRGEAKDIQKLVHSISKIDGLEFFLHDATFSVREIEELKKLIPGLVTFKPSSIP